MVSRQIISKWESEDVVPELNKLIEMYGSLPGSISRRAVCALTKKCKIRTKELIILAFFAGKQRLDCKKNKKQQKKLLFFDGS